MVRNGPGDHEYGSLVPLFAKLGNLRLHDAISSCGIQRKMAEVSER
jgi:hypothetical protein